MRYMGFMNGSYRGRRNEGTCGMPDYAKVNGWDVGVRIEPDLSARQDTLRVYMTGGSHDAHGKTLIGLAWNSDAGPRWEPAEPPAVVPVHADGKPVIAALPINSHLNRPQPAEYVCVVLTGRWPSGEPRFGTARITRDETGEWTVTEHSDYWNRNMSQTEAVTAMVEAAGHSRPPCTKLHTTR